MLALISAVIGWLVALLLVGTSPFGMGVGVHRDQLLDPVLPHVHVQDGRVVRLTSALPTSAHDPNAVLGTDQHGVSIGAGTAGLFVGIGAEAPALPVEVFARPSREPDAPEAAVVDWCAMPHGISHPPPDPPPLPNA